MYSTSSEWSPNVQFQHCHYLLIHKRNYTADNEIYMIIQRQKSTQKRRQDRQCMYNIKMWYVSDFAFFNTGYQLIHFACVTLAVKREINIKNVDSQIQQKFFFIILPCIALSKT
jgi:hypothetical protein